MAEHTIETDVVELRTSYKYLMDVVEKTSVQVDAIQHQTNKIPLIIQRHDDFLTQIGKLEKSHEHLEKDHSELKSEFKSWLNKGIGGWVVAGVVFTYISAEWKDKWAELSNGVRSSNISLSNQENQTAEAFRRIKNLEEKYAAKLQVIK